MTQKQQVFQVESIVDYRVQSGRQFFKVMWKGYQQKDSTWEPLKNLKSCMDLVKKFKIQKGMWFKTSPQKPISYPVRKIELPSEQQSEKDDFQGRTNNQEHKNQTNQLQKSNVENLDKYIVHQHDLPQPERQRQSQQGTQIIETPIPEPEITILKMLKDRNNQISFRVKTKKGIQSMTRSQIYKNHIKILLQFYEKFIHFKNRTQE